MKKFLLPLILVLVAARSYAYIPGSPIGGGGTGTTNASDLSTGTVAVERGGTGSGTAAGARTNLGVAPTDNPSFTGTVTLGSGGVVSTCSVADNQCGMTAVNVGAAADNVLQAGMTWFDNTAQCYSARNNDNTITFSVGCMVKAFPVIIDNVVATDNILLFRVPRAITLLRADCYASVDNVVGSLMECATGDVTSCTVLDSWTVTNATSPFTDSSMTDGAVAAGAWLRWSTTSVGTTSVNRLSCTVQYRE
jgi:hypothetical protein